MPRGGRRPGAGAPKGNWNAFTWGNRSARARRTLLAIQAYPDGAELAYILIAAGVLPHPTALRRDTPRKCALPVLRFLDRFFFDSSFAEQSKTIREKARVICEADRPRREAARKAREEARLRRLNDREENDNVQSNKD